MLISDIRTTKTEFENKNEDYELIDNESQNKWTDIMRPKKCLLKFQCSNSNNCKKSFHIFSGEIMI